MRESVKEKTKTKGAAYIVYNNSVAAEVARALPVNKQQLRAVKGFGIHKAALYGPFIFEKVSLQTSGTFLAPHPPLLRLPDQLPLALMNTSFDVSPTSTMELRPSH